MARASESWPRVAIIGAGFSGLCLAIRLKQAGIESFTILEKADRLGGTWRDNVYPGAACDTPAFSYCFSFEQKHDWSRKWAEQPEILGYLEHCARKYGLEPHLRLGTEVVDARFVESEGVWRIRTASGAEIEAEVLISSVGQLNRPSYPKINGLSGFRGGCFHSARWDHGVDLAGKRVAVIGNAASAIQFVPRLAPLAARLDIFQRSANWMVPRGDRAYSEREKRRFARWPWLARLYRCWIWLAHERRFPVFRRNRIMSAVLEHLSLRDMRKRVASSSLQAKLVPDYPVGGKRILISDDYYESLGRENVALITTPIDRITDRSVVGADGTIWPVDVIILATGFESTEFLAPMRIYGADGQTLDSVWRDGARAYLGMTVPGFPNFFMTYGPNTNLGHNSIIFMIECQVGYILAAIRSLLAGRLRYIDLRPEVMERFYGRLGQKLAATVWAATGKTWYKTETGVITNNWPSSTILYWWLTRRYKLRDYRQVSQEIRSHAGINKAA